MLIFLLKIVFLIYLLLIFIVFIGKYFIVLKVILVLY